MGELYDDVLAAFLDLLDAELKVKGRWLRSGGGVGAWRTGVQGGGVAQRWMTKAVAWPALNSCNVDRSEC